MDIVGDITGNLSGSIGSLGATAKTDVNTEVDNALDTALPASPTLDSINDILDRQEESIPQGTITADAQTTTNIVSDISITTDDQFNGRIITFRKDTTTANLRGQQTDITGSTASSNTLTITAITPTFGFADILGDQFSKNTGATKPVLAVYNGGRVQAFQFGNGDEAFLSYHIPHDCVPSLDLFIHVHWSQVSATITGGTLDFKYFAMYAKGHNQVSGSQFDAVEKTATFSSINVDDGGSGLLPRQHFLTEIQITGPSATAALFDVDDIEPDGVMEVTFEMDANNLTNSVSVLDPFIHLVDLHYQSTGIIGTKQKAPDFYT
jgi:hypothetical protein